MSGISRRELLCGTAAGLAMVPGLSACATPGSAAGGVDADELARYDGLATADLIAGGEITAEEAVMAAITRASKVEPEINAIVNDSFAQALEQARRNPGGLFAGVPTFIKDLQDVKGQPTEFGSRAFKGYIADSQSPFIDAILATGVISLGKSTTPESGAISTTEPLSSGPTRNPWNLAHSTGGSSGGAAALTAARVVPFAQASDGGGSIRIPASCCGLFGLKPSRGRTVRTRLGEDPPVDLSVVLAVTRSVRDTAALLDRLERKGDDAVYAPVGRIRDPQKARLRIGLDLTAPNGAAVHPEVIAAITDTAKLCADLGHTIMPVTLPVDGNAFAEAFMLYWAAGSAQFAQNAAAFAGKPPGPDLVEPWTLALAQYYEQHKDAMEAAIATLKRSEPEYEAAFDTLGIDVLLTPVLASPPPRIGEQSPTLDFDTLRARVERYAAFTPLQNASGAPAMSVPLSWSGDGLPIGSHFAARKGQDGLLLALALELELARPWAQRMPPVRG